MMMAAAMTRDVWKTEIWLRFNSLKVHDCRSSHLALQLLIIIAIRYDTIEEFNVDSKADYTA